MGENGQNGRDGPGFEIEVHGTPEVEEAELAELRRQLEREPRAIPSRFLYDERGSQLFERICELPEYYQTRTEAALLRTFAAEVIERSDVTELVELGSGAASKTRILLRALMETDVEASYVPIEISEEIARRSAGELAQEFPGLHLRVVVGDFLSGLEALRDGGRRLVLFLGGTIGNFPPPQDGAFLERIARRLAPGDHVLLGTDLIKDPERLEDAYDDSQGVTAEFNLNILSVVNQLAEGDFDPRRFKHRALYDRERRWIEMRLVSQELQRVRLERLDLDLELGAGEEVRTEVSAKYDRASVTELMVGAGLEPRAWYADPEDLFGLTLARKA